MCLQETSPVQRLSLSKCHKQHEKVRCSALQNKSAVLSCAASHGEMGKEVKAFWILTLTIPATSLDDELSRSHPAVPATTLYQEPPKPAIFAKCSRASYQPGCTSAQPLGVKAPPPQQLYLQPCPIAPSSHLADFTQERYYYYSVTSESQSGHSVLSSLPTRLAAPRRLSAALSWEESHILRFLFLKHAAGAC